MIYMAITIAITKMYFMNPRFVKSVDIMTTHMRCYRCDLLDSFPSVGLPS
jgi:hypothetical protein